MTVRRRQYAHLALLFSSAPLAAQLPTAGAADVETRWDMPVTGNWEDPARWSNGPPVGTAPAGTDYAATIDAAGTPYTIQVNPASNAKAASVTLDSPDATLRLESGVLDTSRLVIRRGVVLTSGSNVIRNATIEYTPGAVFGGNASLENVSFATDVTFTGGGTAFPTGLNTGGHTITFQHVQGVTQLYPFGPGTHIFGGGAIVSNAEHGFESMYVYAPGGSLTIDAGVEVRTGSGNIHLGPPHPADTQSVLNRGTLRSGVAPDGFARSLGLTNVINQGLIATDRGRIVALNLANAADVRLAGRIVGGAGGSVVDKLVNDGSISVTDRAALIVRGLDNRGRIDVTGGRLGVYDDSYPYGTLPMTNTGTINLHDAELELGVGMASDQVDVAFNRTGTKSLIVQGRLDNTGRTLTVSPANRLFVGANGRIVGGTIAGAAGGLAEPVDEESASWGIFDGVTLAADWDLPALGRGAPRIENGLTLAGGATISLASGLTFIPTTAAAHTLGGTGRVIFDGEDAALRARDLTIGSGVTVETGADGGLIGSRPFVTDGTLVNAGTIRALDGHTIQISAANVTNSGTIEVGGGGSILSESSVVNTGTIRGTGRIDLESLQSGGLIDVSPGTGLGLITLGGDATLGDPGTLRLEIGGAAPDAYDHFATDGALALGGTLHVELLGGYVPAEGSTFQILGATEGFTGAFSSLELPRLPGELAWDTGALSTSGRLGVVPEPASAAVFVLLAGGAALSRRRLRR